MVQRRIGQHQPKMSVSGSDRFGDLNIFALAQEDNRTRTRAQQRFVFFSDEAELPDGSEIRSHDGKRLILPMFPRPKTPHGITIKSITGKVVSAESLNRQDHSSPQQPRGAGDRVAYKDLVPSGIQKANSRAALRASIRLSMKAAIGRVVEFALAVVTHFKTGHGRALAIVGNVLDNGKSRTAIGAVNKRIAIAPIRGIEKLSEQVVTGGRVRRNQRTPFFIALAANDVESALTPERNDPVINALYARQRRRLFAEISEKTVT